MQTLVDKVIRELENGNFSEAILHCDQLIASFPDNYIFYEIRGNCYLETGKFPEAIINYDDAVKRIDKSNEKQISKLAAIYNRMGYAKIKLNELKEAIEIFKEAEILRPNFPELQNNFANAYRKLGEYQVAIEYCNKAIDLKPNFAEAYNNRGNTYYLMSKDFEAISDYTKALEINPNYAGVYYNRGTVYYYTQNNAENAKIDWEKAIELNPGYGNELNEKIQNITESQKIFSDDTQIKLETDLSKESTFQSQDENSDAEQKENNNESEYQSFKDLTDFYYSDSHIDVTDEEEKEKNIENDLLKNFDTEKIKDIDEPVMFNAPELQKTEEIKEEKKPAFDYIENKSVEDLSKENSELLKDMDDYFKTFETPPKENEIIIPEFNFKDVYNENVEEDISESNLIPEESELPEKNIIPEELRKLHNYISSDTVDKENIDIEMKSKLEPPEVPSQVQTSVPGENLIPTNGKILQSEVNVKNKGKKKTILTYILIFILLLVIIVGFVFIYQIITKNNLSIQNENIKIDSVQLSKSKDTVKPEGVTMVDSVKSEETNDTLTSENKIESKTEDKTEQTAKVEVKESPNQETSYIEGRKDLILIKEGNKYFLQLGSFKDKSSAENKSKILSDKGIKSTIKEIDLGEKGKYYRVIVGDFDTRESAISFAGKIEKE